MSVPLNPPPQLARFPADVHDAYWHFLDTGDEVAVHTVARAALVDFLPKNKKDLPDRALGNDARLIEDLGYDSLAIAELVFFFEDLFKVTITTKEIRNVSTVGELHTFVTHKLAANRRLA
jgi:acyl carrier protein